jgi:zinc/manganese transport system substrate-binding protein
MRKLLFAFVAALVLAAFGPAHAALKVVATTSDIAAIAREVGSSRVMVEDLSGGQPDIHFVEPKPSMIRRAADADLLVVIGAELEAGWLPPLLQTARNSRILPGASGYLDLSREMALLEVPTGVVSRAMGDVHAAGNPHYWLDPQNGIRMARAIAERLGELDPGGRQDYDRAAAAFERKITDKTAEWRVALAPLAGKPVITYHKSFEYLARAFGFRIVDQIEPKPGIAPTASHLNRLIERIRSEKIALALVEPFREQRSGQFLAEETGIRVAIIPGMTGDVPGINTYAGLFDRIVAELGKAGAP